MVGENALSMAPGPSPFGPGAERARRGRALGLLGVAALLAHVFLLGGMEWTWSGTPSRAPVLRVRAFEVTLPPAQAPEAVPAAPGLFIETVPPVPPAPLVALAGRVRADPPKRRISAPAVAPVAQARAQTQAQAQAQTQAQTQAQAPTPPIAAPPDALRAIDEPIPLYRTRIPPAATLQYAMRRGSVQGNVEMRWQPTADAYTMRLDGSVDGVAVLSQVSEGTFDLAGLAPARYTDRRQRRQTLATNFRREAGTISFSGSAGEFPLLRGSQDHLSWMLQLAAVLSAEPERRLPGATVALPVVGVRGEPAIWAFRCIGTDEVSTASGSVPAVKLVRESRALYDTAVEVWLDPQRHFLPVRALLQTGVESQTFELVLQKLELGR